MGSFQETLNWYRAELENSESKLIKSSHIPGFSGFRKNRINLIGSRPGMGTTNLLLSICTELAGRAEPTLFVTTHHSELEIFNRLKRIMSTESRGNEMQRKHLHLHEHQPSVVGFPPFQISSLIANQHLKNVVIDTTSIEIGDLKELLISYEVTVIIAKHLGKSVEKNNDHRPRYKDFTVKKINPKLADVVAGIFTPEVYNIVMDEENNSTEGVTEFIVLKSPFETATKLYKINT